VPRHFNDTRQPLTDSMKSTIALKSDIWIRRQTKTKQGNDALTHNGWA